MAEKWYYNIGGQQHGPVSPTTVKELAASGQLAQTDMVWKEGMPSWVPAGKLKGLFTDSNDPGAFTASNQGTPATQSGEWPEPGTDISADERVWLFPERQLPRFTWFCYAAVWVTFAVNCIAFLMPNTGLLIVVGIVSLLLMAVTLCTSLCVFVVSAKLWGTKKSGAAIAGLICSTIVVIYCTMSLMCTCTMGTMMLKGLDFLGDMGRRNHGGFF